MARRDGFKMSDSEIRGHNGFMYTLAEDAITTFYTEHPAVRQYMYNLGRKIEKYGDSEAPEDLKRYEDAIDEATGAADELVRAIKRADPNNFSGDDGRQLRAAVYDEVGIPR